MSASSHECLGNVRSLRQGSGLTINMYSTPLSIGHQLCHSTHPSSCSRTPLVNSKASSRILRRRMTPRTRAKQDQKHHVSRSALLANPREASPPWKTYTALQTGFTSSVRYAMIASKGQFSLRTSRVLRTQTHSCTSEHPLKWIGCWM
jgi:hypothetical protein